MQGPCDGQQVECPKGIRLLLVKWHLNCEAPSMKNHSATVCKQNAPRASLAAPWMRRSLEKAISFPCPVLHFAAIFVMVPPLHAQPSASTADLKYQLPPDVMVKLVDAPPTPMISLSP